jgi:hypothetical protein
MTTITVNGIKADGERGGVEIEVFETSPGLYALQGMVGDASKVSAPTLTFVKYTGGGYTYWCEAAIGSARSGSVWMVARVTDATGDIIYAGTGVFDQAATDLATVAALTYTLGA